MSTNSNTTAQTAPPHVQEFSIRVPKNIKKKHHVMRFNATLNVDFAQWKMVKLERENNMKEFRSMDEDSPRFGAGSEYNRGYREEVRRKKLGIIAKRYKPEAQPWILKVGGKAGKKFKGIREGGVGENAAFYVFTHAPDGAIEAYPLHEWYNFQPIQRYKSLSAEEAEQEFGRRKKVLNYFSLMLRKRLKGDEEEEHDPEETKAKSSKKSKELKISDMDEWIESDEDSDSEEEDKEKQNESDGEGKKQKGKKGQPDKKKRKDVDDEAFEESDDGDEEGKELDYISDSSEEEPNPEDKVDKELKSVAEEDALRKLLTSDEDEDEENKKSDNESNKDDEENSKKKEQKDSKESKDKKKNKKKKGKDEKKDASTDTSSDSSDSEAENKKKKKDTNTNNSPSATPLPDVKRKLNSMPSDLAASDNSNSPVTSPVKKPKLEAPALPATFAGVVNANSKEDYGITEEAVRRYLMRKPMTATELLTKFKSKRTGVSSERLVETMTQILKKINPVKQTIQGKMYLSIKATK